VPRAVRWTAAVWLAGCGAESDPLPASDELQACDAPEPCGQSRADVAEQNLLLERDNFRCVMQALAARTPGRYEHQSTTAGISSYTNVYNIVLVTADGSVLYATETETRTRPPSGGDWNLHTRFAPGKRCTLKPASHFETCENDIPMIEGTIGDEAYECAFGELEHAWFEHCEAAPASCE
jgi:hypothetical protein